MVMAGFISTLRERHRQKCTPINVIAACITDLLEGAAVSSCDLGFTYYHHYCISLLYVKYKYIVCLKKQYVAKNQKYDLAGQRGQIPWET